MTITPIPTVGKLFLMEKYVSFNKSNLRINFIQTKLCLRISEMVFFNESTSWINGLVAQNIPGNNMEDQMGLSRTKLNSSN
jgi:hypothetical protein